MGKRILVGIIGIPLILFVILSDIYNFFPLFIFVLLLTIFSTFELLQLFEKKKIILNKYLVYFSTIFLTLSFYIMILNRKWDFLPFFLYIFFIFIYFLYLIFKEKLNESIIEISLFVFLLFYTSVLPSHILLLRNLIMGKYLLFLVVLLIWFNDSFAYFGGLLFGKKKLPLKVSPNKSYAGIIFALIFSIISIYITNNIFLMNLIRDKWVIILGIILGIIVIFSDLIESILKRSAKVKDSTSIFPGHGGVLDIFDSWFFTIPLFYYILKFLFYYKLL